MKGRRVIFVGGLSFIIGALAFVGVFSYLAATFDYPKILDGSASDVLPRLQAGGPVMRAIWAIYAFLPFFLIPGALGAFFALRASPGRMSLAVVLATIAAFAMSLGLMRWPSVHWALASHYLQAGAESRQSIEAIFQGLNLYLGNFIGEFLGEVALALFFALSGSAQLREPGFPRWLGWAGIGFGLCFIAGAWRNAVPTVQFIADINNGLLPLWMLAFGSALCWRTRNSMTPDKSPERTHEK